jgi:hypothetical protein
MVRKGWGRIRDMNVFPLLAAALAISCVACAGMAIREAESNLGPKLHARELTFEVTAWGQAVDPRVADAVNAAIEQTLVEKGRMPSERLEPLAYAVALQTGFEPVPESRCWNRRGGLCCSLLCRVMRTDAKAVMTNARDDLDREFRVDSFDPHVDPTRRCAQGLLGDRLQCLRELLLAGPSQIVIGPFLVSGRITSAVAKAFDVQAQMVRLHIAEVQNAPAARAAEREVGRDEREQETIKESVCKVNVEEAGKAFEKWRTDPTRVSESWEYAKIACGDLWLPVYQQRMDNMVQEAARQRKLNCSQGCDAEVGGDHEPPDYSKRRLRPRNAGDSKALRDRVLGP